VSTYCTKDDMLARFDPRTLVQLTDRPADDTVPPATAITDSVLDQARTDAGTLIDSYISVVTVLPVTDASALSALTLVACDIAFAKLYRDAMPELVSKKHDQAIQWLRDVRDNKMRLFASGAATEGEGAGLPELAYPERQLDARKLRDVF
jgi:phage gp36-like protein